jgi:hypothetical protein
MDDFNVIYQVDASKRIPFINHFLAGPFILQKQPLFIEAGVSLQ